MNFAALQRWDWAITLVFVIMNGLWLRARADALGLEYPELDPGFRRIVRAFFFYFGGTCLLWGLGAMTGWGAFLASRRYPLTPYDIAYFGLGLLIVAKSVIWIYFRGGAEFLARHGMIFRFWPSSSRGTKIVWALLSAAVVVGIGDTIVGESRP